MHVIPQEGILVAAQLVEKVVYVDMKALEERAAVSCWRPVSARTDRKLGLIRECAWRLVGRVAWLHAPLLVALACASVARRGVGQTHFSVLV